MEFRIAHNYLERSPPRLRLQLWIGFNSCPLPVKLFDEKLGKGHIQVWWSFLPPFFNSLKLYEVLYQTGRVVVNNLWCPRGWHAAGCCALHAFFQSAKTPLWVPRAQQYQLEAACEKMCFLRCCGLVRGRKWGKREGGGNSYCWDCPGPQEFSLQFALSASPSTYIEKECNNS